MCAMNQKLVELGAIVTGLRAIRQNPKYKRKLLEKIWDNILN